MRALTTLALAAFALTGLIACAHQDASSAGGAPTAAVFVPFAAERGQRVAETYCAACHAVGPSGDSPSAFAPPLRNLRLRYSPISLERHVVDVVRDGAFGMRPQLLPSSDAEDVAAYIEWLRPAPGAN